MRENIQGLTFDTARKDYFEFLVNFKLAFAKQREDKEDWKRKEGGVHSPHRRDKSTFFNGYEF